MEVKEENVPVPSINDVPNEILVMILEQIPFRLRLRMTEVCRRWNEVVFSFFGDHILLRLDENYGRSVGLLTNRIYRSIAVTWGRKRSKWMPIVERFSSELSALSVYVEPWNEYTQSLWKPSDFRVREFSDILETLKGLKKLYVEMRPKILNMFAGEIFGLTSLEFLSIDIIDAGRFSQSHFDFHLLPKLRRLVIESGDLFKLPYEANPKPCHCVEDLVLRESLPATSFLRLSKLFPNLKMLKINGFAIKNKHLTSLVKAWPQLEILEFGMCPSLLKHFKPEVLLQLPKLRRLILTDVTHEDPKYDLRNDVNFEYPRNYSLLEPILHIPTLEELYISNYYIGWEGKLPKATAPGCRVYIEHQYRDYVRCV